ncbi:hypothetical protein TcasGA2_TC033337 [Tribolium castaneum]|uniref:Uncharacterized protein n=1 Tax=Tribolium castaneum TaxID=7070 RepID=A0A139WDF4_TRICA|nr:PREDICTED: uncharacterized protein LOC103313352 [Tribolium castaneum]KYB25885.1 hypothetical protein TcasGA2_TC033337 [Tribolium castaneum]|eukprot:XP_008194607.1 PREDICTED: uncharacterized protein LOC103313352 [Tribolium castaneum]
MRTGVIITLCLVLCLVLIEAKPHHGDSSGGAGGGFGAFGFGGVVAGGFAGSSDSVGTTATTSAGLIRNFIKKGADCNRNRQTTTTTTTTTTEASA